MYSSSQYQVFEPTEEEIVQVIEGYSAVDTHEAMKSTIDSFTEDMIDAAHKNVLNREIGYTLLDVATGVGDLPLRILEKYPKGKGVIFDGNSDNVRNAMGRIADKGLEGRLTVKKADMITYQDLSRYDLIMSIFAAQTTNLVDFIAKYTSLLNYEGELGIIIPTKSYKGIERGSSDDMKIAFAEMFDLNKNLSKGSFLGGVLKTAKLAVGSMTDGSLKFYNSTGYRQNIGPVQKKAEEIQNNYPNLVAICEHFRALGLEVTMNGQALGISDSDLPVVHNMAYIKARKPVGFNDNVLIVREG
jgi:cyclopropane fatty-acyl-phospholipid synthase-like methyltransferase